MRTDGSPRAGPITYAEALTITTQVVHLADSRTGRIVCWNHTAHTVGVRTWDGVVRRGADRPAQLGRRHGARAALTRPRRSR